jgi:hypothetical protein
MSNAPTPEEQRAALSAGLELAGRLDVCRHKLARCRAVISELRADPQANVWRAVGRLEVILEADDE